MPSILTEDGSAFPPLIEVPNDGEGATSASLKDTFAQDLTDRSRYLYAIATTTGWWRIRTVTSLADLRGRVVTGTGDICIRTGYGVYRYDATHVGPDDPPWVVESDFGGMWIHENALVPFQTRHFAYRTFANSLLHTATAPSPTWVTAVGLPLVLPAGLPSTSMIEVSASIELASGGAGSVSVGLGFAGSPVQMWDDSIRAIATSTRTRINLISTRDASGLAGGVSSPLEVGIFIRPDAADDAELYGPGTLRVRVVRP